MSNQPGKSPWLTLELNKWADLFKYGNIVHYRKDCTIVGLGTIVDRLYYIIEGNVKYSIIDINGQEKVVTIVGKGTLFGEGPIFTKEPTNIAAIAISDCTVCEIKYEQVIIFLQSHPELAVEIINCISYKIKILLDQLSDLSFKCSKGRIASLLVRLASEHGINTANGIQISRKFTQQELAELVGCSRVSVSRALNALRSEDLIAYEQHNIVIKQLKELLELGK